MQGFLIPLPPPQREAKGNKHEQGLARNASRFSHAKTTHPRQRALEAGKGERAKKTKSPFVTLCVFAVQENMVRRKERKSGRIAHHPTLFFFSLPPVIHLPSPPRPAQTDREEWHSAVSHRNPSFVPGLRRQSQRNKAKLG